MSKFRKDGGKELPAISTASLPDIVFMLLFFFMVSTTMREVELKIKMGLPDATEVAKIENKTLVSYIYVGAPLQAYQAKYGTEPRIQLNDKFADLSEIVGFVDAKRESMDEVDIPRMTISIKADQNTKMGIITDIKEELKTAQAYKLNYATRKAEK